MSEFSLHPRLAADCMVLGELPLCLVLLQNNSLFPWLVLVPKINGLREIIDLPPEDQQVLMAEIAAVSSVVKEVFAPYKLNVAGLGNVVEQLHIHVIARFTNDIAWPDPVWGKGVELYQAQAAADILETLQKSFAKIAGFVPLESSFCSPPC